MLIKLRGGSGRPSKISMEPGAKFLRYLFDGAYDKGEITDVTVSEVTVDFVDTIRVFPYDEITLVYDGANSEHFMFVGEGKIVKDFRGKTNLIPQIDELDDLLDFDKWMT